MGDNRLGIVQYNEATWSARKWQPFVRDAYGRRSSCRWWAVVVWVRALSRGNINFMHFSLAWRSRAWAALG